MSHSSINDKLRQLASDIQAGVDNSDMVNAISMPNEQHSDRGGFITRCVLVGPKHTGVDTAKAGGDYSVTKHTGWLVLQRLQHHDGKSFIAPTFCETKPKADLYASAFDNVVAIMPIEWEE